MALILLFTVCCVELLLLVRSLITRSRMEKTRSVVDTLLFAIFCMLLLTSVIQWNFRWYGLAVLLFFWATRGIIWLFKEKGNDKKFQARRVILKTVSALLLVFIAISPALIFPQYELPEATGNYEVGIAQHTFVDESRIEEYSNTGGFRMLNVSCWHPVNVDDKYPLVVFSHGGLGTNTSNESLYIELASQGYVVCSIDHAYHSFSTKFEDGTVARLSMEYFRELQQEDAKTDKQQSFEYYQKWMSIRTGDINFVLDTILENTAGGANGVYSLINGDKIGVMGHSLGGSAALAMARQRDDVDAVIALEAPFLNDIVAVKNNEFIWLDQRYPVPVLNIYSDSSWDHLSEWAQYARNDDFLSNPPEAVYNLYLPGRGHFSLTDLSLASPLMVRFLEGGKSIQGSEEYLIAMNKACLNFFDRYLKGGEG